MKSSPKTKGSVWLLGDNGRYYTGVFLPAANGGHMISNGPGYVKYVGWRKTAPVPSTRGRTNGEAA